MKIEIKNSFNSTYSKQPKKPNTLRRLFDLIIRFFIAIMLYNNQLQ